MRGPSGNTSRLQKVDAGDVLLRRPVAVGGETSLGDYLRRLQREASEVFTAVIDQILNGTPLVSAPQSGGGRYFPRLPGPHAGGPSRSTTA